MLPPISDVTHITLAHCDAVGRGYPPHQFSVTINSLPLEAALGAPFARVVVLVALRATVVGDLLNAVFLIPDNRPPRAVLRVLPAHLVAVGIVVEGPLAYENRGSKRPLLLSFSLVRILRIAAARTQYSIGQSGFQADLRRCSTRFWAASPTEGWLRWPGSAL